MAEKIRVAYLGNQIAPGGGATSLFLMVKSVDTDLFEKFVFVSTCKSEEMKKDFLNYCTSVEIVDLDEIVSCQTQTTQIIKFIKHRILAKRKTKKFIESLLLNKIDILHVNNSVFTHTLKWIKKYTDIKIISHIREKIDHDGINHIQKFMISNILKYSDQIITISDNEAQLFKESIELSILANPFDFEVLHKVKGNFRIDYKIDPESIIIGMFGRFDRFKGHLDFLKASKILLEKINNSKKIEFVIIGLNPPKPLWKRIIKKIIGMKDLHQDVIKFIVKNNLTSYIKLIPYQKNIFGILKEIDIVVRPSLNGDPWGRDIIESMSFSKPIVATGDSEFFIKNAVNGYLTKPGSPNELAEKIMNLIVDDKKRELFGRESFKFISEKCDLKNYGNKVMSLYTKLQ